MCLNSPWRAYQPTAGLTTTCPQTEVYDRQFRGDVWLAHWIAQPLLAFQTGTFANNKYLSKFPEMLVWHRSHILGEASSSNSDRTNAVSRSTSSKLDSLSLLCSNMWVWVQLLTGKTWLSQCPIFCYTLKRVRGRSWMGLVSWMNFLGFSFSCEHFSENAGNNDLWSSNRPYPL